jgi:alpha-N-dichloroacetyl-p-aminophenylserinol N-oxygenase
MYTTAKNDAELSRAVLERIGKSWDTRVAVRKERLDLTQYVDPSIPDFPISMVPFWDDEDFSGLDEQTKLRFLGAAWIGYNEKAIYLEDEIVQPLCSILLKGLLPGVGDPQVKQVLAQVQVDEQFHILMCLDICNVARQRHHLDDYRAPEPLLGIRLKEILAKAPNEKERMVARLAYASVAEMSINAYLNQVANDMTIQPLNRINTDMHRKDESVHGIAFREITASVYRNLDADAQRSFRTYIADALDIFTSPDLTSWSSLLDYVGVPGKDRILAKLDASTKGKRLTRDYTVLGSLFDELGIKEEVGFRFD